MTKCDCYHENTRKSPIYGEAFCVDETYGVCYGTKECDECYCHGDESQCTFYPEKRKKAEKPMVTAEMWIKAQEDGETYITTDGDASYSVVGGFIMENLNVSNVQTLSNWMNKIWKKQELRKMTKAEAEKEFGIKIVG